MLSNFTMRVVLSYVVHVCFYLLNCIVKVESGDSEHEEGTTEAGLGEVDLEESNPVQNKVVCPSIVHGEPFTDRKSTFQAHAAQVQTTNEVNHRIIADDVESVSQTLSS